VQHETPATAGSDIHLVHDGRRTAGAPPLGNALGIGVEREHQVSRRFEDALDVNLAIGRRRDRGGGARLL